MSINFDTLPKENPFGLPDPGLYIAEIKEATTKACKDATKPDYLNMRYSITTPEGKSGGSMYDIISESDSQVVLYKIARFCRACGMPLQGSIELSDLAKVVTGKKILVDVKIDDSVPKYTKAVVDVFNREAYWKLDELEDVKKLFSEDKVSNDESFLETEADDTPFNAADSEPNVEADTTAQPSTEY